MADLKIMFLHGMEGTPEGTKPTFLKEWGHKVVAPVLPKDDWKLSVARAVDCFNNFKPDLVVGSSRGGAIAALIPTGNIPKILIAPAWTKFSVTEPLVDKTTAILHCREDDMVDYTDSEELVQDYGCVLIECGSCHRMGDDEALNVLLKVVEAAHV